MPAGSSSSSVTLRFMPTIQAAERQTPAFDQPPASAGPSLGERSVIEKSVIEKPVIEKSAPQARDVTPLPRAQSAPRQTQPSEPTPSVKPATATQQNLATNAGSSAAHRSQPQNSLVSNALVNNSPASPRKAEHSPEPVTAAVASSLPAKNQATVNQASRSSGVDTKPVLVEKLALVSRPIAPRYPKIARQRGLEGVALIEVWLDENGQQTKQILLSSSGALMLDESALDAVRQWQFSPYMVGEQRIARRVQIPVRFSLD